MPIIKTFNVVIVRSCNMQSIVLRNNVTIISFNSEFPHIYFHAHSDFRKFKIWN